MSLTRRGPFELKILPSCPLFKVNRVRPYKRPPSKKEQAESLRRLAESSMNQSKAFAAYNCGLYPTQMSGPWYSGKPGWWL